MAYYALLKLHVLPHELLAMDEREKAFVVATVQKKCKADQEQEKKLQKQQPKRRVGARRRRR